MRLHEKGLVYRGSYLVNWSPNLQTAVSDLEVRPFYGWKDAHVTLGNACLKHVP